MKRVVLAERGPRLMAAIFDQFTFMLMLLGCLALSGVAENLQDGETLSYLESLFLNLMAVISFFLLNASPLAKRGQTYGKLVFRVQIVSRNGTLLPLRELLIKRYLPFLSIGLIPNAGLVAFMIDSLFIFRQDRRCLHDLIADTVVAKAGSLQSNSLE